METVTDALIDEAIDILRDGDPLPLDIHARLLELGVDVNELIENHSA